MTRSPFGPRHLSRAEKTRVEGAPINVKEYGAKGDGISASDGAITASDNTFTSAGGAFTSSDVGKVLIIAGAGAAGVGLVTTIASITSASEVETTEAAATTVSSSEYFYSTDDTAAFQDAAASGLNIYTPDGYYGISDTITLLSGQLLEASSRGAILHCTTSTPLSDGFVNIDNKSNTTVRNLSLVHIADSGTVGVKVLGSASGAVLESVSADGFGTNFWIDGDLGAVSGTVSRIRISNCRGSNAKSGYGLRVQFTDEALIENFEGYSNSLDGIKLRGHNDGIVVRGGSSHDNGDPLGNNGNGIDISAGGLEVLVDGLECYSNVGAGVYVKSNLSLQSELGALGKMTISNCNSYLNTTDGIQITRHSGSGLTDPLVPNISVIGGRYHDNLGSGVVLGRCRNVTANGVLSYDNEQFGITVTQAIDVTVANCHNIHNALDGVTRYGMQISASEQVTVIGGSIIGVDTLNVHEPDDYAALTPSHDWPINISLTDCDHILVDESVHMSYYNQNQQINFTGTAGSYATILAHQKNTVSPEGVIFGGPGTRYHHSFTSSYTKREWVKTTGYDQNGWMAVIPTLAGVTASRPAVVSGVGFIGATYFDTTLGTPIWYDGSNWVDSAGTTV